MAKTERNVPRMDGSGEPMNVPAAPKNERVRWVTVTIPIVESVDDNLKPSTKIAVFGLTHEDRTLLNQIRAAIIHERATISPSEEFKAHPRLAGNSWSDVVKWMLQQTRDAALGSQGSQG